MPGSLLKDVQHPGIALVLKKAPLGLLAREEIDREAELEPSHEAENKSDTEGGEGELMTWVGEIIGKIFTDEKHESAHLSHHHGDAEEEEDGTPHRVRHRESRVFLHVDIPKACPSEDCDEGPDGIEEGNEENADGFSAAHGRS